MKRFIRVWRTTIGRPGRNVSTTDLSMLRSRPDRTRCDASTGVRRQLTGGPLTASIRDVAGRAGVSVGHRQQRPQPARDGQRGDPRSGSSTAIADARLRPQRVGPPAAGRPSRTIGLVVLDIANPFFTDVARGVEDVGQRRGPRGDPVQLRRPPGQGGRPPRRARRAAGAGRAHHADRRALPAPGRAARAAASRSCWSTAGRPDADQCSVAVDDVLGGRLAADHLLERGHRRIAFVGGSLGPAAGAGAARRASSWRSGRPAGPTTR